MNRKEALEKIASFKEVLPAASTEIDEIMKVLSEEVFDNSLTIDKREKAILMEALSIKRAYYGLQMHKNDTLRRNARIEKNDEILIILSNERKGISKKNDIVCKLQQKINKIHKQAK